jgi:type IV fimbrial biogenesis protein FimT
MGEDVDIMLGYQERRLMLNIRPGRKAVRAFTLVEMMISITIVALALALATPEFRIWLQNTQVRTVAESIQNGLQIARNEAIRRNCNVEFTVGTDTSWTVTAKPPSGSEVIGAKSATEGTSTSVAATVTGSTTATFNGLGRLDNTTPLTAVEVASTVSGTKKLKVQVGSGGQIRLCDPNAATGDPRRCL